MLKGDRFLRVRGDSEIWRYDPELALKNPDFEVITERMAFPERFAGEAVSARIESTRVSQVEQTASAAVDLSIDETAITPPTASPELIADATRGFGRGVLPNVDPLAVAAKPIVPAAVVGLQEV